MFNLIVKGNGWKQGRDSILRGRIFEYTDDEVLERFYKGKEHRMDALASIPTLFVSEIGSSADQNARVGRIHRISYSAREATLEYNYDPFVKPIPNSILQSLASELAIESFEFSRTHWAIKDIDLFQVLYRNNVKHQPSPKVFTLEDVETYEENLISVMMPFDKRFDIVYASLQMAAKSKECDCLRADNIWDNEAIIQDIVSLICRSRIVICDCTGRNPNVFYEAGIAHALGRNVILITQSKSDIPFDLRHLRYVLYKNHTEGRKQLVRALKLRIQTILDKSD